MSELTSVLSFKNIINEFNQLLKLNYQWQEIITFQILGIPIETKSAVFLRMPGNAMFDDAGITPRGYQHR